MQRHRSAVPSLVATMGDPSDYGPRRVNRGSALLMGLAVLGATITVAFGIWMAGVVPAASMGQSSAAPISSTN